MSKTIAQDDKKKVNVTNGYQGLRIAENVCQKTHSSHSVPKDGLVNDIIIGPPNKHAQNQQSNRMH